MNATAHSPTGKARFQWDDPLLLDQQLSDDERQVRDAARAWRTSLRAPDVIARWGGEEFAVLFPDSTADEATVVLRRLRAVTPEGQSFSAGVVQYRPGEDPASMMSAADGLMYEAKGEGRDQVRQRDGGAA